MAEITPIIEFLPYASLGLGAAGMAVAAWIVLKNRQIASARAAAALPNGTEKLRFLAEQRQTAERLSTATTRAEATIDRIEAARSELAASATELERYLLELKQRQDHATASLATLMRADQAGTVSSPNAAPTRTRRANDAQVAAEPLPGDDVLHRDAISRQVLGLARDGHTAPAIAQATGLHIGVVELMLSLAR